MPDAPTSRTDDQGDDQDKVLSYLAVRRALGLIGLLLPIGLLIYGRLFKDTLRNQDFPNSISDFYHTPAGDVLVGALCAMGVFFLSYKGHAAPSKSGLRDKWLARAAGVFVIGVAILPVHPETGDISYPTCQDVGCYVQGFVGHPEFLHFGSAILFFVTLGLFCVLQFPMGAVSTRQGPWENPTYFACGAVIFAAVALFFYYGYAAQNAPIHYAWMLENNYLFWVESIGVWAFALSWLIKGRTLELVRPKKPSH